MDSQPLGLSFFGKVAGEEKEEALHLGIEGLPGKGILDGCDELGEVILHRLRCNTAGGGLEVEVRSTPDTMGG